MRAGSGADRAASVSMLVLLGVPEALLATLLLLSLGAAGLGWFPTAGLRSGGARDWPAVRRVLDLAWHLALPVAVMALPPLLLIARFLRESVARAASAPFAVNLRAWGTEPAVLRRRLLRAGSAPLATLCGSLVPMLVTGSIVVETVFSIDGVGRLTWNAVDKQDQSMVMAVTLLVAVVTLLSLALSDLLHRLVDPRVRLAA
jgi:peptide/nickel transport system permease protein